MADCAYCGLGIEERDGELVHAGTGRATCYARHAITGPRATPAKTGVPASAYRPDCPLCRAKTKETRRG